MLFHHDIGHGDLEMESLNGATHNRQAVGVLMPSYAAVACRVDSTRDVHFRSCSLMMADMFSSWWLRVNRRRGAQCTFPSEVTDEADDERHAVGCLPRWHAARVTFQRPT